MDKYTPPPKPLLLASRIRAMEPKSTIFIKDSPASSVKARVWQIKREYQKKPRQYRTKKEMGGTRVYRDA